MLDLKGKPWDWKPYPELVMMVLQIIIQWVHWKEQDIRAFIFLGR